MTRSAIYARLAIAAGVAVCPVTLQGGGELPPAPVPAAPVYAAPAQATYTGVTTYRFCMPYPYYGPSATPCAPPSGFTHYTPGYGGGGSVYPGYAYAGHGAAGYFPGPFATGAVAGLLLGAHIF